MKKNLIYILFLLGVCLSGCENENDSGYYNNIHRVYLPEEKLYYSFGLDSDEVKTAIVKVPVNISGLPVGEGKKVKAVIVGDTDTLTTATPDMYTPLPEEGVPVEKDSMVCYIPIELLRDHIPAIDTTFRIAVRLEANKDFGIGVKERQLTVVSFSNYLEEPEAWSAKIMPYLGKYDPVKYRKLLEYFRTTPFSSLYNISNLTTKIYNNYNAIIMTCVKKTYDFFQAHPEYGFQLPVVPNGTTVWPFDN